MIRALTPCRVCGRSVFFVMAANERGELRTVALDPSAPIYICESDGDGGTVWSRWRTPDVMTAHTCGHGQP